MFNRFERLHRRSSILREHIPPITDPYRQVRECEFHPVYQGPHSFMGYEHPRPARREWKVVPIKEPYQFFEGLENLISHVQTNNTESHTVGSSPFDPYEGTEYYLKNRKAYQRDLEKMYKKYSRIHKRILKKFTDEEKKRLQEILQEAKSYKPVDAVSKNPNWSPGTNHHTGLPYDVHVDPGTGKLEKEIFPEK